MSPEDIKQEQFKVLKLIELYTFVIYASQAVGRVNINAVNITNICLLISFILIVVYKDHCMKTTGSQSARTTKDEAYFKTP